MSHLASESSDTRLTRNHSRLRVVSSCSFARSALVSYSFVDPIYCNIAIALTWVVLHPLIQPSLQYLSRVHSTLYLALSHSCPQISHFFSPLLFPCNDTLVLAAASNYKFLDFGFVNVVTRLQTTIRVHSTKIRHGMRGAADAEGSQEGKFQINVDVTKQ